MKKIIFLTVAIISFGIFVSCEKESKDPVLDMTKATAQEFTGPAGGTQFVLTEDMAAEVFAEFSWSPAEYNIDLLQHPTYVLQMDIADSSFKNKRELISTTATEFTITVGEMNEKLLGMGLQADMETEVAFRILSFLNTSSTYSELYSQEVSLMLTPYSTVVSYPKLWVPGDYQGWNPAAAPNVFDFDGDGVYNGYIYFPEGGTFEFKFTSDPDWEHTNYGVGATPFELSTDAAAGNLVIPGAGGYQLEIDIINLTWNYGDGVQNWGVIGEWLSWSSDIDLIYDIENQQLSVTVEDIPAAENQRFKFRANDGWDLNLGAKDPDDGTLIQGGADILIPEGGTITFILRFTTPEPTYEIVK